MTVISMLVKVTLVLGAGTLVPVLAVSLPAEEPRGALRERFAQSAAPQAQRLTFDVVSIKRTPEDTGPGADFMIQAGGRLVARNNPVLNFITNSFGVPYYTVIGGPDWMRDEKYDMEAKADGERPRPEIMQMLQALLADRFQLRAHRETRELPAYVLTVARGGAKLTRSKDGECIEVDPSRPVAPPVPLAPGETRRPQCGNNLMTSRGVAPNMRWSAVHIDMRGVTSSLAAFFRRPVVDRTGLTGFYDVELLLPPLQPSATDVSGNQVDPVASAFTVLQEQLGLRVEEGRGPVDVLVVDRLERPAAN